MGGLYQPGYPDTAGGGQMHIMAGPQSPAQTGQPGAQQRGNRGQNVLDALAPQTWTKQDLAVAATLVNMVLFAMITYHEVIE